MKLSTVLIIVLIGVIAYVLLKDNQGNGNSKDPQDQPRETDGQTKQGEPASQATPAPKSIKSASPVSNDPVRHGSSSRLMENTSRLTCCSQRVHAIPSARSFFLRFHRAT